MQIHIAKTNGILWRGEADSLTAPALEGEVTVLKGHVPLATTLRAGTLLVKTKGQVVFTHEIERGVLEVTATSATVLL
ncbi:MAG: F0F1 ATP synthase subunit epsilon [Candidatus Pacebacteria bacterium]|nr:F0F1 ATP synthase subunit epsilon [Candidatus Paceibacterota bacterium]